MARNCATSSCQIWQPLWHPSLRGAAPGRTREDGLPFAHGDTPVAVLRTAGPGIDRLSGFTSITGDIHSRKLLDLPGDSGHALLRSAGAGIAASIKHPCRQRINFSAQAYSLILHQVRFIQSDQLPGVVLYLPQPGIDNIELEADEISLCQLFPRDSRRSNQSAQMIMNSYNTESVDIVTLSRYTRLCCQKRGGQRSALLPFSFCALFESSRAESAFSVLARS